MASQWLWPIAHMQSLFSGNAWLILTSWSSWTQKSVHTVYKSYWSLFTKSTGGVHPINAFFIVSTLQGDSFLFLYPVFAPPLSHVGKQKWHFIPWYQMHLYLWQCSCFILQAKSIMVFFNEIMKFLLFCSVVNWNFWG